MKGVLTGQYINVAIIVGQLNEADGA